MQRTVSYWQAPALDGMAERWSASADVVVIGAGLVGVSAAYWLA